MPTIDADKLKAAANLANNMEVSGGREAFVSPPAVVERLMELVDIERTMIVLEPSAGTGNIAAAAVELGAIVDCVEIDNDLVEVLASRVPGANLLYRRDFLETDTSQLGTYDRVVMNPPFLEGRDIAHVTHALRFVRPAGRLVSVMGEGVTTSRTKAAASFRDLVDERGGWFEDLPADSFAPATTCSTVIVVIPC
ncbi:methyltransferase [Nonomuraea sp. NPDC046802]|uniref:methyltransferase n=1 Tax=Nonomuraea sp. NPDC046802 TaxID=3154919 RepID=UPI0033DC76D5